MWHNSEIIKTTVENSKNVNLYINIFLLIKSIHFTAFSLLRFYGLINVGTCWLLHFKMFKRQPFERHKAWKASKQTVTRDLENHSTIAFTFVLLFLLVLFHRCQRSKQCSESAASVDEGRERERESCCNRAPLASGVRPVRQRQSVARFRGKRRVGSGCAAAQSFINSFSKTNKAHTHTH